MHCCTPPSHPLPPGSHPDLHRRLRSDRVVLLVGGGSVTPLSGSSSSVYLRGIPLGFVLTLPPLGPGLQDEDASRVTCDTVRRAPVVLFG